jgi:hypothetical protein
MPWTIMEYKKAERRLLVWTRAGKTSTSQKRLYERYRMIYGLGLHPTLKSSYRLRFTELTKRPPKGRPLDRLRPGIFSRRSRRDFFVQGREFKTFVDL